MGAANAVTLTGYLRQLDGMSMDAKCDHARFCRVDRTYQSEQARITLSVDRAVSSVWLDERGITRKGRDGTESCQCVVG